MSDSGGSGSGSAYSEDDEAAVADGIAGMLGDDDDPDFDLIKVRADIEYAGVSRGVRESRLMVHDASQLREPLARFKAAKAAATGGAERSASYRAKGWQAQIRQLAGAGERGSKAADRAGLDVSARTLKAWLSGDQAPNARNRELIGQSYERLANYRPDSRLIEATKELVAEFTYQVDEAEGRDVRLRSIEWMNIEH